MTLALALAGAGVAGYLSWVALDSSEGLVCGAIGDCHAVQASRYSEVGGVPVAVLGLLMYLGLGVLTVGRLMTLGRPTVAQALVSPTFALALGGVVYSAYLTYLEAVVIRAICVWCVASALIVTVLFAMTLPDLAARTGTAD